MAVRIRKSVYSLADEAPELVWYRRAVAKLQTLPRSQPGSWEFIAACHGIVASVTPPPAAAGLWKECQHQTWFFLPWHRAYLAGFEAIIAATIVDLGGPPDWALPYWNYSDASEPRARQLPPAFRDRFMASGAVNHLWSPRNQPVPPQTVLTLSSSDVGLAAMNEPNFTNPAGSMNAGFGGPQTPWNHGGGRNGELERRPHNVVHGGIGGLMGDPRTAALDPIFWLHHCNIDRLWEVWRGMETPPRDPGAAQWLTGVQFKLVEKNGATFNFVSQQALNSQTLLHGYKYDNVVPIVPSGVVAGGGAVAAAATVGGRMASMAAPSELIAGNDQSVRLGAERAETIVNLPQQRLHALRSSPAATDATTAPRRFYLSLENVVASGPARDYKVFIDLPDDDRVPLQVGILATFGVAVASDPAEPHGGNGLTQVFDITDGIEELGAANQLSKLRVTFEPILRGRVEEVPDDHSYAELLKAPPADLVVGRVNMYSE